MLTDWKEIDYQGKLIKFRADTPITGTRVRKFFWKEPETIKWIESFEPGDVFFDVGANIGSYSLLSAHRGIRTFAFEPESQNFAYLNENIHRNGLAQIVTAYPLALGKLWKLTELHLSEFEAGASAHSISVDWGFDGRPMISAFCQGIMVLTLDQVISVIGRPDHIKIDVDGLEHDVIAGMRYNPQSVLVELNQNLPEHRAVVMQMLDRGYRYDFGQVETSRRKSGRNKDVGNWIFRLDKEGTNDT